MFIKSKHDWNTDIINKYALFNLPERISDKTISFQYFNQAPTLWIYQNEKERDQEYEWVVKQLDLKVNQ